MTTPQTIVLIGGGIASTQAIATLRQQGYAGRIRLISEETVLPYERPPLSKQVLTGTMQPADCQLHPVEWFSDHEVDVALETRAKRIDVGSQQVITDQGNRLKYDALLIATGGRPRYLPGFAGDRVFYLRTQADSQALYSHLRSNPDQPIVILGAGFIGCEVAAVVRGWGTEVTMVERLDVCLQVPLGPHFGQVLTQIHREQGVALRMGERVARVADLPDGLRVITDRTDLECGALVVAAGMIPNTELAQSAGLPIQKGLPVDLDCRTAVPNIFAAGDVAAQLQPGGVYRRVEHHDTAARQGVVAARAMLGLQNPEPILPWFWSDQYQHSLQSLGHFDPEADFVLRGSLEERSFTAFQHQDGYISGALTLDRPRDILAGRKLMANRVSLSRDQLQDLSFDLRGAARPNQTTESRT